MAMLGLLCLLVSWFHSVKNLSLMMWLVSVCIFRLREKWIVAEHRMILQGRNWYKSLVKSFSRRCFSVEGQLRPEWRPNLGVTTYKMVHRMFFICRLNFKVMFRAIRLVHSVSPWCATCFGCRCQKKKTHLFVDEHWSCRKALTFCDVFYLWYFCVCPL